jgi:hypothetical protein
MANISRREFVRDATVAIAGLGLGLQLGSRLVMAQGQLSAARVREQAAALADLAQRMTGSVLLPGQPGYDAASAPANGRYGGTRPIAVAQCANEADVVTCVNWSQENGIPPVPRGGGHSYAGYSTTSGLLIDIGNLNGVSIDQNRGTAVSGGAALNKNFFDATVDGPLYLPGGTCFGVGVGGLVLGGGISSRSMPQITPTCFGPAAEVPEATLASTPRSHSVSSRFHPPSPGIGSIGVERTRPVPSYRPSTRCCRWRHQG